MCCTIRFIFVVLYVLLSTSCVLCFCIVLCIVSPHASSCPFCICVQVYEPFPLGGKPIAVNNKYIVGSHSRACTYKLQLLSHL
jgi:hypothetical protein